MCIRDRPVTVLRKRRARREMLEKHGPDLDAILSEIEGDAAPPDETSDDEDAG